MFYHTPQGRLHMYQAPGLGGASLVLWHVPKHEAEASMGQVCINASQMVLKSLRSVDLFLAVSGEVLKLKSRSLKVSIG